MKQEVNAKRRNSGSGCRYWASIDPEMSWQLDHRAFSPAMIDRRDGQVVWSINDVDLYEEWEC